MIKSKVKVLSRGKTQSELILRLEVMQPDKNISLGQIKIVAETKEGKAFFAKCKEYYLTITKDCEHAKSKK